MYTGDANELFKNIRALWCDVNGIIAQLMRGSRRIK